MNVYMVHRVLRIQGGAPYALLLSIHRTHSSAVNAVSKDFRSLGTVLKLDALDVLNVQSVTHTISDPIEVEG